MDGEKERILSFWEARPIFQKPLLLVSRRRVNHRVFFKDKTRKKAEKFGEVDWLIMLIGGLLLVSVWNSRKYQVDALPEN